MDGGDSLGVSLWAVVANSDPAKEISSLRVLCEDAEDARRHRALLAGGVSKSMMWES